MFSLVPNIYKLDMQNPRVHWHLILFADIQQGRQANILGYVTNLKYLHLDLLCPPTLHAEPVAAELHELHSEAAHCQEIFYG